MKVEFPTDLDIARRARLLPMPEVAAKMGIGPHLLEPYGHDVAKIKLDAIAELADRPKAKYVVVSAITPTPLGEGKTTTTVGLGDALGAPEDGVVRQTGFDITAASEVMAVLALSTSLQDMRQRLGRMVIGLARDGRPISADSLHAGGAMTVIMLDAIKPNLLQTLENTPVLVHAGPFGNIANGASSVLADLVGIHGGDFLVTEAGFGARIGAQRFFNIKCP